MPNIVVGFWCSWNSVSIKYFIIFVSKSKHKNKNTIIKKKLDNSLKVISFALRLHYKQINTIMENHEKNLKYANFKEDLTQLINKHSMENESDTPDFILANYLTVCLQSFNESVSRRTSWYGMDTDIIETEPVAIKS